MAYSNIDKPNQYFNTKLYTGNGTTQSVTGVGFDPDLVWIKNRSVVSDHIVNDQVRGANKNLKTNLTNAEDGTTVLFLTSFDIDGFTVGTDSRVNGSGNSLVSWNWLGANGTSANTDGSISSTVSANTTSGFSIVQWTGTGANGTVGHGLGVAPKMIIVKADAVKDWMVGHDSMGWTKYINLNTNSGESTASTVWQDTSPTSSVFSVGSSSDVNTSSTAMIAYCFAEKKGFSKFGSYTGNGSTDGTFVYTGFKPAFVLSKCTSLAAEDWNINDNKRPGYNVIQNALLPNSSSAEVTASYQAIDTLSNGFKWRGDNGRVNASGATYIYMAFAESPLVGSNLVPNNAR